MILFCPQHTYMQNYINHFTPRLSRTLSGQWTLAVDDCCLLSVMLTKFSAWQGLQPIRLVFQSPDLPVWSLSYYLPILIFVISSFILVSLDGWAFYNHYLSTYDIQRDGWRVTPQKIKSQVIFVILLVIFVQLNPLLTVAVNLPPFPAVCFPPHPVS